MDEQEFMYYPEYGDPSFYGDIYRKKEFNRSRIDAEEYYGKSVEQICSSQEKILQPHQEFLRNYLSDQTPYNGILLFHGVGTGKCVLPETEVYVNGNKEKIENLWNKYYQNNHLINDGTGDWSIPGDKLLINTYNQSIQKIQEQSVHRLYRQYIIEKIRVIELVNGYSIRLTKSHHLFTENGWSNDFQNNDFVALPTKLVNGFSETSRESIYPSSIMHDGTFRKDNIEEIQLLKIHNVFEIDYTGYVYDLEVDQHHNYVANGLICHNTCAAISIAEAMKPRLQALGKKVYILAPEATKSNFENEIYSFDLERLENQDGVEPGSYQCTGQTYYVPFKKTGKDVDVEKRERQIRRAASGSKSIYEFYGHRDSFPRYVEQVIPKKLNKRPDQIFSNSVIIVDEAHNIVTKTKKEKEKKEKIVLGEKKIRGPASVVKNTIDTLKDIFSGYHAFKADWVKKNKSKLKGKKDREIEVIVTNIWRNLSEVERRKWLKRGAKNVKIVLMSATPMQNDPTELVELINLLRLNDNRLLIDPTKMFMGLDNDNLRPNEQVDRNYLCKMIKGYISYVRGQNPITFPMVLDPPEELLYSPGYVDPNAKLQVPMPTYKINGIDRLGVNTVIIPLRLVYTPMSSIQYKAQRDYVIKQLTSVAYAAEVGDKKGGRGTLQLGLEGRQLSNIVLPTMEPGQAVYGNSGFSMVFKREVSKKEVGLTKGGQPLRAPASLQFSFNEKLGLLGLESFYKPEKYSPNGSNFGLLHEYSPKFTRVIENMQDLDRWGINFAYSDFIPAGALILGIVLEFNGFVRYSHKNIFRRTPMLSGNLWGRNNLGSKNEANPPLVYKSGTYDPVVLEESYEKFGVKRVYRCYKCSRLLGDPIHDLEGKDKLRHQFIQGTFILFISDVNKGQRVKENSIMKQRSNREGEVIKMVLGSKISREGVNFMNVRQVHILDPWHHNQGLYQAMGRAIRHCSHKDLSKNKRDVTIYKYCSAVPEVLGDYNEQVNILRGAVIEADKGKIDLKELVSPSHPDPLLRDVTLKDLATETTDEMVYFRVLKKDVLIKYVERLMKETAIDCALFKAMNVFPQDQFTSERDGSRLCDYLPCNYPCIWACGPPEKVWDPTMKYEINEDTYNLFFSQVQVDRVVRYLQKIFLKNWALRLEDVIELVHQRDQKIGIEYIYGALDKMLRDAPDRPILLDRYKREGYLSFHGDYYVVKPFELLGVYEKVPTHYRKTPPKVQNRKINVERLKPKEEKVAKKKKELNTGALDKLVQDYLATPDVIAIEATLDRKSREELQYLYEKLFKDHPKEAATMIVMKYLDKRRLILETDKGIIGHYIMGPRIYNKGGNKFEKAPLTKVLQADEWLENRIAKEGITILFDPERDLYDPSIKVPFGEDGEPLEIVTSRFYGYFDEADKSFKLVDLSTQATKLTKDRKISKKGQVTGKTCTTFLKDQLVYISQVLSLNDDLEQKEQEILRNSKGTKQDFCQRIEKALRLINSRDNKNRWFLYPGEHKCIQYDPNDPRHILNRVQVGKAPRTCKAFSPAK